MGKTKKKLFDKNNSITFRLVHRSQRDPLIADETAPQRVLVPKKSSAAASRFISEITRINPDQEKEDDEHLKLKRKEEQAKCGIYFEDDYNYLQHVRDVSRLESTEWTRVDKIQKSKGRKSTQDSLFENDEETPSSEKPTTSIKLPSNLFPSEKEESEGMLAKGILPVGPQPGWDPDVVAAMDEDFNFDDPENVIEDDFITLAGGLDDSEMVSPGNEDEDDLELWEGESQDGNRRTRKDENDDDEWETDSEGTLIESEMDDKKSCFTGYSMTSSVIRRNEGLQNLDSLFETLYEKEYGDDTELGPLDLHTIEGYIDPNKNDRMAQMVKEFAAERSKKLCDAFSKDQRVAMDKRYLEKFYEKCHASDDSSSDENTDSDEELEKIRLDKTAAAEDRLDCESVLTTYSNLYNHPKLITDPPKKSALVKIDAKSGLPVDRPDLRKGITSAKLAQLDRIADGVGDKYGTAGSITESRLSQLSVRSKNETCEERRARKAALREYRRERRAEKKANRDAFKEEKSALDKTVQNVQNRLRATKLV